ALSPADSDVGLGQGLLPPRRRLLLAEVVAVGNYRPQKVPDHADDEVVRLVPGHLVESPLPEFDARALREDTALDHPEHLRRGEVVRDAGAVAFAPRAGRWLLHLSGHVCLSRQPRPRP